MTTRAALAIWVVLSALLLAIVARAGVGLHAEAFRAAAPPLALIDDRGESFSLPSASHEVVVLTFGYTRCDDECPRMLSRLAALDRAHPDWRGRVKIVFATVDPQHDPPATLRRYLARFDPSFVGATGSPVRVREAVKGYDVEPEPPRDDPRAHAASITVVDRHGRVAGVVDASLDDRVIGALIERVVNEPS